MDDIKEILVRPTNYSDYNNILDILSKTMSSKFMPEMKIELERIVNGDEDLVGLSAIYSDKNVVVGYITLWKTTETYKIETLAVDPNYQGKGIGKLLVNSIEDYLIKKENDKPISLQRWPIVINVVTDASHQNPVVKFYEKLGYVLVGIIPNEFSYGDRTAHLSKIIHKP